MGDFSGQTFFSRFLKKEVKDIFSLDLYRACLAEFIGVLLLTFNAVGTAVNSPGNVTAGALEAGLYISVIIFTLSTVSGGHVNPAISIGFLVLGQMTFIRFIFYTVCHNLGSAAGLALLKVTLPANLSQDDLGIIYPGPGIEDTQALVCEITITFFLLFGTFAMIDPKRNDINGFAPFQIGLIVVINIFATFNLSGGCMNPARNFGPAIVAGKYDKQWIYWVGDMLGAVIGSLFYDKIFSTTVCLHWLKTDCRKCNEDESMLNTKTAKYDKKEENDNHEML